MSKVDPSDIELTDFDVLDYLQTEEDQIAHIELAFQTGHPEFIRRSIGDVVRARGVSRTAAEAGISRQAIYGGFGDKGDPRLTTLIGVLKALGLHLEVSAEKRKAR